MGPLVRTPRNRTVGGHTVGKKLLGMRPADEPQGLHVLRVRYRENLPDPAA
jgi:hypothetical protein